MTTIRSRGGTVKNPADTKYTIWEWTRGYAAWVLTLPLYIAFFLLATVVRKLPRWITVTLLDWHSQTTFARAHDVRIPFDPSVPPYMLRWWKIPRNPLFNMYFHKVLRSDDDRALHDHPWWSFSIVLSGGYFEHTIQAGGVHRKVWCGPGTMKFRRAGTCAHRLELATDMNGYDEEFDMPAKTIFITGPVLRRWGFHAKSRWVDAYEWDDFCSANGIETMKMEGYAEQLDRAD